MTCSCPASRANLSVTYAHVAAHPQVQIGRLTSRLPSFSCRTVMLWVTLVMVPLPPEEFPHSLGRLCLLWWRAYGDNNQGHPRAYCLAARAYGTPVKQPAENRIHPDLSTHSNASVSPALVIGVSTRTLPASSLPSDVLRFSNVGHQKPRSGAKRCRVVDVFDRAQDAVVVDTVATLPGRRRHSDASRCPGWGADAGRCGKLSTDCGAGIRPLGDTQPGKLPLGGSPE